MNRSRTAGGVPYEFRYTRRRKKTPPTLTVSVEAPNRYYYEIRAEGLADRAAKSLAVSREHQTGDLEFDSHFYLTADAPDGLSFIFGDPAAREAAKRLFSLSPNRVYQKKGRLTAYWSPFREGDENASAAAAAEHLTALAPHGARVPETVILQSVHGESFRFGAYFFAVALVVLGIALFAYSRAMYPVFEMGRLVRESLTYSVPGFAALAGLMFVLLRGRASSHRDLTFVLLLCCAGMFVTSVGGLEFINGAFDRSEPVLRRFLVTEKYDRKPKKKSRKYYLVVPSWRSPGATESFEVSQSVYDAAIPNSSTGTLKTKPGHRGYEWTYESFTLGE